MRLCRQTHAMPNHYHVLVYLREDGLSKAMQKFTMSYTNVMNRRYGRCGSLFQGWAKPRVPIIPIRHS
jgi:hypothetical protein